ncbi:MAG TPA: CPBP family intramembrane glutamic endopeptidase [Candidatus Angelobacter sp.]|nr:CPBP family intramembrane glutamic endopeptidase [Candidatus Angelobacter sp.]
MTFTDPLPRDPSSLQDPPLVPDAYGRLAPVPENPAKENPVWHLSDVIGIAFFAFIAIVLSEVFVAQIVHLLPHFRHTPLLQLENKAAVLVPAQLAAYALVLVFIVVLLQHKYGISFGINMLKSIRWNAPSTNSSMAFLAGGGGLALVSLVLERLLNKWTPKSLPMEQLFDSTTSAYLIAATGILAAPFMEELVFRGFLYPALARWTGRVVSIVVTGALFAAIHQQQLAHAWAPLLILFVVGVTLTTVRALTGSLAASVLVHMGYNTAIFTLMFIGTHGFHDFRPR